ncbi:MAG TPA: hypothetical protein VG496_14145, partial [Myxococcales bacterium]|nr:hypothetical protein [Myxococcales bacterium]
HAQSPSGVVAPSTVAETPMHAQSSRGVVATTHKAKEPATQRAKEEQARGADSLEGDATVARRAGDYARAAALYREAAATRKDSDPQVAAWDLAHAVECLAAGGNVSEAIAVRAELLRSFPDQSGPRAAANAALRSVPLPPDADSTPSK